MNNPINDLTDAGGLVHVLARNLFLLQADGGVSALPWAQWTSGLGNWMVGLRRFTDDASVHADHWERHTDGDEILCLVEGRLQVWLEDATGLQRQLELVAGDGLRVPCGTWHRMQVREPGRLVFVTPGSGNERRGVAA